MTQLPNSKPKIDWKDLYASEIGRLNQIVRADGKNRTASFSTRNPGLGKMVKCPHCGQRVRSGGLRNGLKCCNSKFTPSGPAADYVPTPAFIASTKWKWSQERKEWEHAVPEVHKHGMRRKKPRLSRNRPPLFLMHDLIKQWEGDENLVVARKLQDGIEGLPHFWTPQKPLEVAQLASFAEKVVTRRKKAIARRKRLMQKRSRRINFRMAA